MVQAFGKTLHLQALGGVRYFVIGPADGFGDIDGRNGLRIGIDKLRIGARHGVHRERGGIAARRPPDKRGKQHGNDEKGDENFAKTGHGIGE